VFTIGVSRQDFVLLREFLLVCVVSHQQVNKSAYLVVDWCLTVSELWLFSSPLAFLLCFDRHHHSVTIIRSSWTFRRCFPNSNQLLLLPPSSRPLLSLCDKAIGSFLQPVDHCQGRKAKKKKE